MNYFSVPSDFKNETINKFQALHFKYENARVIETYGNITIGNNFESGRSVEILPKIDLGKLKDYISYSKEKGIGFNYTMNASHMNNKEFTRDGIIELMTFLENLYVNGVRSLTIALPSVVEIIQSMDLKFQIKTSTICQITNATKAHFYKKLGASRIVPDESINRQFGTLKQIRDVFGEGVELIVNPVCNKDCTMRMFHYNQISSDSVEAKNEISTNYYSHRCFLRRYEDIGNLMKISWIRPEDLHYYNSIGIHYFKLQGRGNLAKGDIVRAVQHYFEEKYDGDLMQLIDIFGSKSSFKVPIENKNIDGFLNPFFVNKYHCSNNCISCHYCDKWAEKCISSSLAGEVYKKIKNFYEEIDGLKVVLKEIKKESQAIKSKDIDLDASFSL